jgi:hypothetical protein
MKDEGLKLLPPKPDLCQECATRHSPDEPHNKNSLYYQMHFKMRSGRDATWEDAMAHCDEEIKQLWREELVKLGKNP